MKLKKKDIQPFSAEELRRLSAPITPPSSSEGTPKRTSSSINSPSLSESSRMSSVNEKLWAGDVDQEELKRLQNRVKSLQDKVILFVYMMCCIYFLKIQKPKVDAARITPHTVTQKMFN